MKSAQGKVAIIGSGIGGLATSIRLAKQGYCVHVFEAHDKPGGKVNEVRIDGFRFDAGPSLFTLPALLDELFADCGRDPDLYYSYSKLDNITRYFFPDKTVLNAWNDPERLASEFEQKTGEPRKNILRFLARSAKMHELTADIFLFNSMHKAKTFLRLSALKTFFHLHLLNPFRSMARANERHFKDKRVQQLFNRYATYNGSDPYRAPATLNIIAHLEHNIGAFYLKGGMYQLTKSLYQLALEMGVQFHFNQSVEKITIQNKKAVGIEVKGSLPRSGGHPGSPLPFDLVVSNMDVVSTYRRLMPDQPAPERILGQPRSTSALIFYWGMSKTFKKLDVHNIFFSESYAQEFDCLQNGCISDDPTVYLYISAKADKADAPEGMENWFTMINVPHDQGQDWEALVATARKNVLVKLHKMLGVEVAPLIVCEEKLTPRLIEQRTSSLGGALYGSSSNNMMAAFMRHPNFSRKIKGLYFCGGSVHPGGGIPLCLASAKIIEKLIPRYA